MDLKSNMEDEDLEMDMSPMIDMVFLLLIFFVVASAIVDTKVPVEVPSAVHAVVPEDETGRFLISVNDKGDMYIGQDVVSIEEVKARLEPEINANPKTRVLIRSDGRNRYKVNEEIMEACAEVGASDMIFSAFEL